MSKMPEPCVNCGSDDEWHTEGSAMCKRRAHENELKAAERRGAERERAAVVKWLRERHDLLSLIAAARELEERRWVPVTERLPEGDVEVLASSAYGERVMRGASNFRHLGVTHWMPLPKGPTNGR